MDILNFSNPNFYILVGLSFINMIFMCFVSHKFLHIMQLSGYRVNKYWSWVKDTKAKWISRIAMLSLLSFIAMFVCNILFRNYGQYELLTYLGLVFYFWFMLVYIVNMKNVPEKKRLVLTKRVYRIYSVVGFFILLITFGLVLLSFELDTIFRFSLIAITPICLPVLIPFSVLLLYPLEKLINKSYIKLAKKTLKKNEPIIKIGITGSFGKTSTKNFLTEMLKKKYTVISTPESFNTPMGITKTINARVKKETQILVCEMGADHVGDIKEICDIVKPDIAILTGIGNQHLETFGSYENIEKTKYELVESLNEKGKAFFNGECESLLNLYNKSNHENKVLCKLKNEEIRFDRVQITSCGMKFNLVVDGKTYFCKTNLLGHHNLQNIMLAVYVAMYLGVEIKDIVTAIFNLESVYHRLELKKSENGITIIDDSFNSNVQGTIYALKTLELFKNGRKIVVTPGLVELGEVEEEENIKFGERIAEIADICVIVNNYNKERIKTGLLNKGFKEENIYEVESLYLATQLFKTILKKGDVVLLENDLPDNYR